MPGGQSALPRRPAAAADEASALLETQSPQALPPTQRIGKEVLWLVYNSTPVSLTLLLQYSVTATSLICLGWMVGTKRSRGPAQAGGCGCRV